MRSADELLKLAKDCHAQASITLDPEAKGAFAYLAQRYRKEADDVQNRRTVASARAPIAAENPGPRNRDMKPATA